MKLSEAQKNALRVGSPYYWRGAREVRVSGDTMAALERRGLAEVREEQKPYRRCVYRLTNDGIRAARLLVPLSDRSEEELIAFVTDGTITDDEYFEERERRGKAAEERELEDQKRQAYEVFLHAGARGMSDLDLRAAAQYAQVVGDSTAERELSGEVAYREGRAA